MKPRLLGALLPALSLLLAVELDAQTAKRPLDHDAYDRWNRIQAQQLSDDGVWLGYVLTPGDGDGTLIVRRLEGSTEHRIPRGTAAAFTPDARFVVFRIQPMEAEVEKAEEAGRRGNALPQDSLGIMDLSTGQITKVERMRAFQIAEESSEWVAYHKQAPAEGGNNREEGANRPEGGQPAAGAAAAAPTAAGAAAAPAAVNEALKERRDDKTEGTTLVLRSLRTGQETSFEKASSFLLTPNGFTLVYAAASKDGTADGVFRVATATGQATPVLTGEGNYERLTLDEGQRQLAFLSNRDEWTSEAEELGRTLYYATLSGAAARAVAREGTQGVPAGWWVSENSTPAFSPDGTRLFFGTAPKPVPEPKEKDELLENVVVDIWNWRDGFLQSAQLTDLEEDQDRTYQAVWFVDGGRVVQLADPTLQSVDLADQRNGNVGLGEDDREYRNLVSWDTRYADVYLVDARTGSRELLAERVRGGGSLSPTGAFVYWWDGGEWQSDQPRGWMVMDPATKQVSNVTGAVPVAFYDEISDTPSPPGSYGMAGWTTDDRYMVVYDAFDVWLIDPRGREAPKNLTAGYGRANNLRLRVDRTGWDEDEVAVPLDREVLLSAFNVKDKSDGFFRARLDRGQAPTRLVMEPASYGGLTKAENADVLLFTKATYLDFPNLWVSDPSLAGQRKLSDANPQQAEYLWGSAELISWTSGDGTPIEGLLYKPEGFDPTRQYPMMVFFYERYSDQLHNHFVPNSGTSINRTFYASRGYLVFVPDIPYKTGYPGESAMNAVVPGILSLVAKGFVDKEHIGVQGHSWGGYQIAYMVTRTNIFAAAEAGAPVANMTSAYGGIRWETGRVRQMQYEVGQSRIGGTLWDSQHRFIENSPLFFADKIETPLLILHNDADGAVPWQEGIQLFAAMRRLDKPSWLVNYNGQGHGVSGEYRTKDWAIRMQQFFDHYLQGAPAPVWMVEGVPAVLKGKTLGLELVEPAKPVAATSATPVGGP